jgi:hypothetical protein
VNSFDSFLENDGHESLKPPEFQSEVDPSQKN